MLKLIQRMDPVLAKEIQNLIDDNRGDNHRLQFILESMKNNKKIYNSDQKYLALLLSEHSSDEDILERLNSLNEKPEEPVVTFADTPKLHFQERWCTNCNKGVFPERKFSVGALVILLLIGIIPGLLYYALKNKVCPICSKSDWGVPPKD